MAQLKDLLVQGPSRFIGDVYANTVQLTSLSAPTSAGGTTYGAGTNGNILRSNGTSVYWSSVGNSIGYNVTDRSSATAISTGTGLMTERAVYYGLPTINNSHAYTSSTTIYAPTAGGTANYVLWANGATSTPTWKAPKDALNYMINQLDTGSSNLTANDYVITQYVGGGTTTTTYHRRPASALRVGGLLTGRKLKVALGSTTDVTFDGTADVTSIPVSGTLGTANGGTGNTSFTATRLVYSNTATKLASTTITSDGTYLGSVSYLSVNTSHQTSYRAYVNGTSYFSDDITSAKTIYFGNGSSSGKGILSYSSTYPNYGIWYFDESTDVMTFSAAGNANSKTGADLAIGVHGAGTLAIRNNRVPHTGNTTGTVGSGTQPVWVDAGTIKNTTYSLSASVNAGTTSQIAYYSGANAISGSGGLRYYTGDSTASTPVSYQRLHIYGTGCGNTAANMISGTAGLFSFGDGGPQITFDTNATPGGGQAGALIYTDHDTAATGVSWHFVSNQTDWNVTSKRFHARTSISIGTDLPNTSYNLYVNGTSYFNISTSDTTANKRMIIYGNNRYLSVGASGFQAYTGATNTNTVGTLYLNYNGGILQIGQSSATVASTFHGNVTHNGIVYFANGTTYYINNSGTGNLNALTVNATTASTSTATGALIVKGGVGVAGQVTATRIGAGGSNTSYALYVNGNSLHNGIAYFGNGTTYYINNSGTGNLNALTVNSTTNATSTATGALIVKGGVGIANNTWIGGTLHITANALLQYNSSNGCLEIIV